MENCFSLSVPEKGFSEQSVKGVNLLQLINILSFTIFCNSESCVMNNKIKGEM